MANDRTEMMVKVAEAMRSRYMARFFDELRAECQERGGEGTIGGTIATPLEAGALVALMMSSVLLDLDAISKKEGRRIPMPPGDGGAEHAQQVAGHFLTTIALLARRRTDEQLAEARALGFGEDLDTFLDRALASAAKKKSGKSRRTPRKPPAKP